MQFILGQVNITLIGFSYSMAKQELDEHETELKTQSTFAHLRDDVITEK